jgi:predicted RNase H-like HicB family nuclease
LRNDKNNPIINTGKILMNYPISYPLVGLFAKLGASIVIRVNLIHDKEAGVLVATSPDIKGLVLEVETYEQLQAELKEAITALYELNHLTHDYRTNVLLTDNILTV